MSRVAAIIQARMGSTRLPGKVLRPLSGRPMLWHVLERVKAAKTVDDIILATAKTPQDRPLKSLAKSSGVACYFGSESDVLDRYRQAAKLSKSGTIIRITADCPLIDPEVIDACVRAFKKGKCDYASNAIRRSYPDGLDVEVFSLEALDRAWKEAKLQSEREHVTSYIWKNPHKFKLLDVVQKTDLSSYRWCVDKPEDLAFVERVYNELYREDRLFTTKEVLALLRQRPELAQINAGTGCNEGYEKSLREDRMVMKFTRSRKILEQAKKLIPGCSQTFSKAPNQFVRGVSPVYIERGQGSHVWDVDGNEFIDYSLALGPIILGHNDPDVSAAVKRQMDHGTVFSLPHPLEVEVAKVLTEVIPCAEMVRFGKNGSDVTAGAVRVARACTGREKVLCCGYHGWQDWYVGTTTRRLGVPKAVQNLTEVFNYNDIASLEKLFKKNRGQVACVVMEPIGVVEPKPGFLKEVARLTRKNGALLIYDEVVTGFRVSLGGAQEHYGVTPDLACFAKAMANGYPVSAVVGKREIMKVFDDVFFSFTFGGEALSLAAALATIKKIKSHKVIAHIWRQGKKLKDAVNESARSLGLSANIDCIGLPPHTVIRFLDAKGQDSLVMRSLFQQEMVKRGILFLTGFNICLSHSDQDVKETIEACRQALEIMAAGLKKNNLKDLLEGPPVEAVFRKA